MERTYSWDKKMFGPPPQKMAGKVSPPRSGRRILSAIEVVSASRSMVYITRRSRVFIHFYVPCNNVRRKDPC